MQPPSFASPRRAPSFWGFLFLILAVTSINCAITQYLAAQFGYQQALGHPLWQGFYNPFAWNIWQFQHYKQAKMLFDQMDIASLAGYLFVLLLAALIQGFSNRRSQAHKGLHGTAHWATPKEIRQTGLLPKHADAGGGVYVGAWQDKYGNIHYLRHNGPEHIAAIAPTRSGKGVGLVIPTLLSWPHSVVINDMKGELWALTAGWRQQEAGNRVLKFDPAAKRGSCSFNPLAEVRLCDDYEVADVQNLVTIIVDPDGKGLNDHWTKTAHAFLTGVTLHLLYKARNAGQAHAATLYDVAMALSDPNREIGLLYTEMLETQHKKDPDTQKDITHPVVAAAARDMLNRPETERGSVLSSAMSYLSLYRDPLVAKNTSRSDFRISQLMNHSDPVSLYLVVRPADKDRLKPLMRLILNQIVRVLTREEMTFTLGKADITYKHRLLLMLDEFPSFGRLEVFQEALAFIAGYGIKAYLIMQDISQLRASYGPDESILSNCHVRVAYAPNKPETAEWLSKMTGTTTVTVEDVSTSGHRFGAVLQNVNHSFQTVSRPLMTPDECQRLAGPEKNEMTGDIIKAGAMLIFVAGFAPIYGTQILYFIDSVFNTRAQQAAPTETDCLQAPVQPTEALASAW
jgi:type IV secretion system protein VirD4